MIENDISECASLDHPEIDKYVFAELFNEAYKISDIGKSVGSEREYIVSIVFIHDGKTMFVDITEYEYESEYNNNDYCITIGTAEIQKW